MSFGGSVSAMLTTLKNNRRKRVSTFKKLKTYEDVKYKKGRIDKKATHQQLIEIREKFQKENKRDIVIKIIVISAMIILFIIIFNYIKY